MDIEMALCLNFPNICRDFLNVVEYWIETKYFISYYSIASLFFYLSITKITKEFEYLKIYVSIFSNQCTR